MYPDYKSLIRPEIQKDESWPFENPKVKAFHVRGFTTFKRAVSSRVSQDFQVPEIQRLHRELLAKATTWSGENAKYRFGDELFSPRQAINAAGSHPKRLNIAKAIETIAYCSAATFYLLERQQVSSLSSHLDVFDFMYVEPAMSYIIDFSEDILEAISAQNPQALSTLCFITGQDSKEIFYDMAAGATVTYKLAFRVQTYLRAEFPDMVVGEISSNYSKRKKYTAKSSETVNIDQAYAAAKISQMHKFGSLANLDATSFIIR